MSICFACLNNEGDKVHISTMSSQSNLRCVFVQTFFCSGLEFDWNKASTKEKEMFLFHVFSFQGKSRVYHRIRPTTRNL